MNPASYTRSAIVLFAIYAAAIAGWHHFESRPSSLDETRHMRLSLAYRDFLVHHIPLDNPWSHVYPPFYHLSLIPALTSGVPSETRASFVHLFFLIGFLLGSFAIGRSLKRPEHETLLAVLLLLSASHVIWASRRALTDFPLTCWVTLCIGLLLRTERFSNSRDSMIWGLAAGLGMLLKAPFLFFMSGPVLWALFNISTREQRRNALWALGIAGIVGLSWYFWQWAYFLDKASGLIREKTAEGTDPRTLAGMLYYFRILWVQLGPWNTVFTALGIGIGFFKGRDFVHTAKPLIAWLLSGFVILTLIVNKDPRHSMPLLPALAWLAAMGWGSLMTTAAARRFLIGLAGCLLVWNLYQLDPPKHEDWSIDSIGDEMVAAHQPPPARITASILSHHPRFFSRGFVWELQARDIPFDAVSTGDADVTFPEFLIRRMGDQGTETGVIDEAWREILPESEGFRRLYHDRRRLTLPDGSPVSIYQRQVARWSGKALSVRTLEKQLEQVLHRWVSGPLKVTIQAAPERLLEGRWDDIHIVGGPLRFKILPIQHVDIHLYRPWINVFWLMQNDRLGLLAADSLCPDVTIRAEDLTAELSRIPGITKAHVEFTDGTLRASARYRGWPVGLRIGVDVESGYLVASLRSLHAAGIPLPGWILGKAHTQMLPLISTSNFPVKIAVSAVTLQDGAIRVKGDH